MEKGKLNLKTKLGFGVADVGGNLYITINDRYFYNLHQVFLGENLFEIRKKSREL